MCGVFLVLVKYNLNLELGRSLHKVGQSLPKVGQSYIKPGQSPQIAGQSSTEFGI